MAGRDSPNRGTPWIADGVLHIVEGSMPSTLPVDSDAWFSWLAEAARFYVKHPIGNFFCRKELRKRGGRYWSAYRRYQGRVYRQRPGPRPQAFRRLGEEVAEADSGCTGGRSSAP